MAEPVSEPLQTTPMRVAESNASPRFELPARSCDAHFHVFEPGYPHVAKIQYTFPDGTLDQYLRVAEYLGIERMVLVQPSYYGIDNRLTIDVLRKVGSSCRGVVQIDDDISDAELDDYHEAGVRSIRLDLFSRAGLATSDIEDYIRLMGKRTAARGWHLQFYTPGRIVRDLLPFLADFDETFVVDHMGYMKETDGLTPADQDHLIDAFEQNDNFWIKLSGAYRIAQDKPLSTVEALGRRLVAARPDRLCWGSDWPHLPDGQRDTGVYLNLLADWAPDADDRHKILVDSADQLFFTT